MARLREPKEENDDDLPELKDLLKQLPRSSNPRSTAPDLLPQRTERKAGGFKIPGRTTSKRATAPTSVSVVQRTPKKKDGEASKRRQRALKPICGNSILSQSVESLSLRDRRSTTLPAFEPVLKVKQTPKRTAKKVTSYAADDDSPFGSDVGGTESTFIVADNDEEDEALPEYPIRGRRLPQKQRDHTIEGKEMDGSRKRTPGRSRGAARLRSSKDDTKTVIQTEDKRSASDEALPPKPLQRQLFPHDAHIRPTTASSLEDKLAVLRFSPPRQQSPRKAPPIPTCRPTTPPAQTDEAPPSPSKRLASPSKKQNRIPTPPHRPSIDAFWSQDEINTWNDHHSPKKILTSPAKQRFLKQLARDYGSSDEDDKSPSPYASPNKSKTQSPTKRDRTAIDARKAFESRKHKLAEDFLQELDSKITNNQVSQLASETGGIHLIWSKKLNSTAGRANWRREGLRKTSSTGSTTTTYKHHASIELAEKVIDSDDRLLNVVAHEFCHLANFMVSNVRDNPHGKEFKAWAAKVTRAFGDRGIKVTTKHSYVIDYKYVWTCLSCGHEFKRHSKSVDPKRHSCGSCKGELVQTKPVPRQGAKEPSEYQAFVKENFQRVREEQKRKRGKVEHGAVMETLGRMYREEKARKAERKEGELLKVGDGLDAVVKGLEIITIED